MFQTIRSIPGINLIEAIHERQSLYCLSISMIVKMEE